MKANPEKFQFMTLSKSRPPEYNLLIGSNVIKESADLELLELIIDSKLSFEKRYFKIMPNNVIQTPCTQANNKILNIRKYQSLGKCFCEFSIQICASSLDVLPENYFKIQKIHHKTLRIIYQSDDSYDNLLNLDNSVSLH